MGVKQMSITVDWLFEQTNMPDFFLIAGDSSRQTAISGINIMDNPDTIPWLAPGTLVLSTGYFLTDPRFTEDLIEKLVQKQCSGFGIKMNRYITSLPDSIKEQANKFHFPVFNVPFSSSMDQIANIIYRKLFEDEMTATQKLTLLYKNITEAAFRFKNSSKLLQILKDAVNASVFLTTDSFEIIDFAIKESDSNWSVSITTGHFLFGIEDIRLIKENFDHTHLPRLTHTCIFNNQSICFEIFPIMNRSEFLGFLIIAQENGNHSAYDFVHNIESVLSIVMLQMSVQEQQENSSRDIFLQKLLAGKITSDTEIEFACRQNRFLYELPRTCLVFHDFSYESLSIAKRRVFERKIFALTDAFLTDVECKTIHTVFQTNFVYFLFWNMKISPKEILKKSIEIASECCQSILSQFQVQVGISEVTSGIHTIQIGFEQAQSALQIGSLLHPGANCFSYEQDLIFQKLLRHFSQAELSDIYNQYLGILETYDTKNQSDLLLTLETYLEHFLNTTQTAKALYIHRNTMNYRLGQIEELLGVDLSNRDIIYQLQTAFYVRKLLHIFTHPSG